MAALTGAGDPYIACHNADVVLMPARVAVVLNDSGLSDGVATALREAEIDVAVFPDSLAAWRALKGVATVDVVVANTDFGLSMPSGAALIRRTRRTRPSAIAVLIGKSAVAFIGDEGRFLRTPVTADEIVQTVVKLVAERCQKPS
jgi:hypothetical protein